MNTATVVKFFKQSKCFEAILNKMHIASAEKGRLLASLVVEEEHVNKLGFLHRGCASTLVDVLSSYALVTHKDTCVTSVSADMDFKFLNEAKIGDKLKIDANLSKYTKDLAFLDVDIINESTGDTLVKATHTKFLFGEPLVLNL